MLMKQIIIITPAFDDVCLTKPGPNLSLQFQCSCFIPFQIGKAVDEYGRKFRPRSIPKAKQVGFKEWAIHAGVAHHLVEKEMEEEAEKTPAMKEVVAEVAKIRKEAGVERLGNGGMGEGSVRVWQVMGGG